MNQSIPYPEEYENGPRDPIMDTCPGCSEEVPQDEIDYMNDYCSRCVPTIPYEFKFEPNEGRVMSLSEMERVLTVCRICQSGPLDKTKSPCFECRVINEKRS